MLKSAFLTAALLAASAGILRAQTAPAPASTPAASAPAPRTIVVTATLEAYESADLFAKDSGFLLEVKADLGDHVKKGQILATIDDPELQKQVASSQAALEARQQMAIAAQATLDQSQKNRDVTRSQLASFQAEDEYDQANLKRQQDSTKATTQQELDEAIAKAKIGTAQVESAIAHIAAADADVRVAQANLAVAKSQTAVADAELQRLQTLLQYTQVVAPFDGIITRRMVSTGDMVQSGAATRGTPLFNCQRLDIIRIFCDVPEPVAASIAADTPAGKGTAATIKIFASDSQPITATISRVAMSLNPASRTMRAEIDVPNPNEKLRPGMYAQVTLTLPLAAFGKP